MNTQVTTLENGLRVASVHMPSLETVSVGVYVDVGTRYERGRPIGISHMFEHMVFKGTKTRTARQIAEDIESVGGHLNAYTTRDMTAYYARVLKDDLSLAVDILSDLLTNARFDPKEVARERDVIAQEIGQAHDTPDDIVFDHLQNAAYPDQPMGQSILGSVSSVAQITDQHLIDFRTQFYTAKNMVVAAAGKLDHDALVKLVTHHFASVETGVKKAPEPALYQGGHHHDARMLEQMHLALGFEGVPFTRDDIYALQLYATILGGGMSSRLFQQVREDHGLAYAVFADVSAHLDTGLLTLYAGTSPKDAPKALGLMLDIMKGMTKPVDHQELFRARAQLKAGLAMALESSTAQSEQLGRHMLMFNRPIGAAEILAKIGAVDAGDVARVGQDLMNRASLSFATVGPKCDFSKQLNI